MADGASSSVNPAFARVGSLWTGYSVVSIAAVSSADADSRAASGVIGIGWARTAALMSATRKGKRNHK